MSSGYETTLAAGFNDLIKSSEPTGSLEHDPAPDDMDEATARDYSGFVNYYIHQVNLLRHLLGESYTVSYADPAKVLFVAHSASGVPCTIEMAAYNTTIDWQESALVAFEKGYVKLELPAPVAYNRPGQVEILKDPGNGAVPLTIRPSLPWIHAMRNQALNFIKAVRGEAPAPCLASFTGDPELVMNAVAMDPLTASVLTLHEIREMVTEMLDAEANWLRQFAGKKLRPIPAISIPKNVRRAEVPVDPALAIANRFMKLAGA
ncbi:MAG: hypothetical protein WCS31_05675 [Verrucomicrobiae bacterium]